MKVWTPEELTLLYENISLPTKDIFTNYSNEYGYVRSYDSIQKKVKALRDFNIDEEDIPEVLETPPDILSGIFQPPALSERKKSS